MFDVEYRLTVQTNYAPNFLQNTDILITLENTSGENKGLECTITYDNIESRFFTIAALAKIVFKINVMSVSASYGSFEHYVRNARNHFGENLISKM